MSSPLSIGRANLNGRPHALYRFYDRTDVLLYVGVTADLPKRMKNHQKEKPWWLQISTIKIEPYETRAEVFEAEAEAIRTENPLYNSTHNTFVAMAPVSPEQAVADFADEIIGRLDMGGNDIAELMAEVEEPGIDGLAYPLPQIASATLIAAEYESYGKFQVMRSARALLGQLDPEVRAEVEQAGPLDAMSLFRGAAVVAAVMDKAAAVLAGQYLGQLDAAEAKEWNACAVAAYPRADEDFIVSKAADFARGYKYNGTIPSGMCMARGQHGANCPTMAAFDIQFNCEQEHVSDWFRFCATHAEARQQEGVTHQDCGTDATVSACEPTQAPGWGWAP